MIRIFSPTDTTFQTNGDAVIQPLKAKIRKEDNGAYYLDVEAGLNDLSYLADNNIIVANTPNGDQAFRILGVKKQKSKVSFRANHVYFDSQNYLIADSRPTGLDCNAALAWLNADTEPTSPFTTVSDVETVNTLYVIRKSLYEAVTAVVERWGGHLVRDNFSIGVRASIGQDNGVTVEYGKNLKDISCTTNWAAVVTKIMPTGKDGIMLPEVYLTSDRSYGTPYTKTVKFEQDIDADAYDTEADYLAALVNDLRFQAQEYLNAHDVPEVTYTLSANLDRITDVGDTVYVHDTRLGIDITTHVIAFEYDCILGQYTQVEFGNFQQKLSSLIPTVKEIAKGEAEEVQVVLGAELEAATAKIMGVLGNSYVIYEGDKILVVDQLPKENAVNVIRINSAGIGFSQTGINGTFTSAWTIDGTLNMQAINVINLTASLIRGGTLRLGGLNNQAGVLALYDEDQTQIGQMTKDGLVMYGADGSYVKMNNADGFAGYDQNGVKIYWAASDQFHMNKAVVEDEITLFGKMRFIPITVLSGSTVVNDGVALVAMPEE